MYEVGVASEVLFDVDERALADEEVGDSFADEWHRALLSVLVPIEERRAWATHARDYPEMLALRDQLRLLALLSSLRFAFIVDLLPETLYRRDHLADRQSRAVFSVRPLEGDKRGDEQCSVCRSASSKAYLYQLTLHIPFAAPHTDQLGAGRDDHIRCT
jgi:hypothetical protein